MKPNARDDAGAGWVICISTTAWQWPEIKIGIAKGKNCKTHKTRKPARQRGLVHGAKTNVC